MSQDIRVDYNCKDAQGRVVLHPDGATVTSTACPGWGHARAGARNSASTVTPGWKPGILAGLGNRQGEGCGTAARNRFPRLAPNNGATQLHRQEVNAGPYLPNLNFGRYGTGTCNDREGLAPQTVPG